ncbi:hypothetical protein BDV25DRAFT_144651 [Aspergillus avenaceus]|uniref:Uncharacterized protein n=1 Tax=Aspergillus avenaceus TaxID=36643 RepID=A0A5N6TGD7_ASPAV|nr:hypothetical protein BDV25DRAFT_144651 [Aspergillus avenaceus]
MAPITIPQFLLPRGAPSTRALQSLTRTGINTTSRRCASNNSKPRVLEQPDKFRPPSHPARRVLPTRNGKVLARDPVHYGPKLTEKEREAMKNKEYPNMFPPEGTVMYKFLTNRWIHIWIAMGVLTSLATFTFTTNFRQTSPFAHLLPPWSALFSHPIDTISQALSVFRMHVQHTSLETREKRHRRVEDADKRRQYRIAHGLEEPEEPKGAEAEVVDDQSPVADESASKVSSEYVDWEGKKKPVKKWLGIW